MRRKASLLAPMLCIGLLASSAAWTAPPAREKHHGRPNLDARSGRTVSDRQAQLAANPSAAVKAFGASLGPQGIVSFDGLTGTPRIVGRLDGYLTAPSAQPAAAGAPDFVRAAAAVFQIDVTTLVLAREYVSI